MGSQQAATPKEPEPIGVTSAIPIACVANVFTEPERAAHFELAVDALVRWPLARHAVSDGYVFEYRGDEERFGALARWVSGEHRCCPWAAYSVEVGPFAAGQQGALRVRVRASEEGVAFLATCYEYVERLGGALPPDSLFHSERVTPEDVRRELGRCAGC
jgi:hypothetical protein